MKKEFNPFSNGKFTTTFDFRNNHFNKAVVYALINELKLCELIAAIKVVEDFRSCLVDTMLDSYINVERKNNE